MARFRRKPRVQWLPSTLTNATNATSGPSSFYRDSITVPAVLWDRASTVLTLTLDYPAAAIRAVGSLTSLADWEGSAYRLRRIVGKFTAAMSNAQPPQGQTYPIACLLGMAFMVVRCDETAGAPLRTPDAYSPTRLDNVQDPWIWRRTWVLQNDFAAGVGVPQDTWQFPRGNADYGSVMDGPHIDARTARIVKDEERLICVISATNISGDSDLAGEVRWTLDWRLLASALRPSGNRRNASR